MEPVPVLVGVEGALVGRNFEVTTTGLRLGREPGNEVWLDDAGVSRQHARVILHNGAVWVQDAGSRNGVFVNGERVADHRTMKPGDKVAVGVHTFELRLSAPGAASSPPKPAAPPKHRPDARTTFVEDPAAPPARRWAWWPFALALFFVVVCIGCFGVYGWMHPHSAPDAGTTAPAWSLSTVVPTEGGATPAAPAPSVSDALAVAAGADAEAQRAKLPDAPAGTTSAELVERANVSYETGRLNDALTTYQMALKLDPACAICQVRIERLNGEIAEKAQAQLDAGMRYWDRMQLPEAVAAWETVILLVPNPADPLHQRAAESLVKAKGQAPK